MVADAHGVTAAARRWADGGQLKCLGVGVGTGPPDLIKVVSDALKSNLTVLGPLVLPVSEQVLFLVNYAQVRARGAQHAQQASKHAQQAPLTMHRERARVRPPHRLAQAAGPQRHQAVHPQLQEGRRALLHPRWRPRRDRRPRAESRAGAAACPAVARHPEPCWQYVRARSWPVQRRVCDDAR